MIFTYGTVFSLVIDLDRPAGWLVNVNHEAMVQVRDGIQRDMAGDEVQNWASELIQYTGLP